MSNHAVPEAGRPELRVYDAGFDIARQRCIDRDLAAREEREHVDVVRDVTLDGVPCRVYLPRGATGLVIHLHGGGFVFNDIEVHDAACRRMAVTAGVGILSIDYRLAPEHRYPAALDDISVVVNRMADREILGLPAGPLFVHGDSAGANLALTTALRHPGVFAGLVLLYPFLDPSAGFDSYRTAVDVIDRPTTDWFWAQYAQAHELTNPEVAPLLVPSFAGLPRTFVGIAELDPLRDEGEALARRLAQDNVDVVATRRLGVGHGYWLDHTSLAGQSLGQEMACFFGAITEPRSSPGHDGPR